MTLGRSLKTIFFFALATGLFASATYDQAQEGASTLFGDAGQSVVIENGFPACRFISRTGSVAYVYFRKHGADDAFAVNVFDWDSFKIRTGWLYFSRTNVAFDSDDDEKRDFNVPRTEIKKVKGQKTFNGMNFLLLKIRGSEKKFMISFNPVPQSRTGIWGAHQKPVFEYIESLMSDYDQVDQNFKQSLAKLQPLKSIELPLGPALGNEQTKDSKVVVEITSEPSGSEIYVNGNFASSTPSKIALSTGEQTITISRPGFKTWERRIIVEAGSFKTINAILDKDNR